MARTTPSEADFVGQEVTEEERASPIVDDDIGHDTDDDIDASAPADTTDKTPTQPADPAVEEQPKMVDVRALQEARSEAREAKAQAKLMEERWNTFLAGQQAPKPAEQKQEAPPVPKWDQDPLAAGAWTQQQIIEMREAQATQQRETEQRNQQEQQFQQAFEKVNTDYSQAIAADPTIPEAYDKLRESQGKELLAMGYTIPQAQAELAKIEREHVQYVASRGLNIGDYIKAMATARGWQAAPVAPPPVNRDLSAVASSQARHLSLSDANGGEVATPVDAKALANMTQKQFNAWMAKNGNAKGLDELMGG